MFSKHNNNDLKQIWRGEPMKNKKDYGKHREKESEFHLSIPKVPVPRPRGGFIELLGGDGGHYTYQQYAEHCLNEQGGEPSESAFKTKFTGWSIEGSNGFFLYPEGPAFKVLARHFMEGDEPITYQADAAHYTALMLCLHPTVFPSGFSENDHLASYQVTASWEPDGPSDFHLVSQKPIGTNGEIFTWKHYYFHHKVSLKIQIFPSPTGRNTIFLGGRLGTIPSESI
jgi:hypothetical protein